MSRSSRIGHLCQIDVASTPSHLGRLSESGCPKILARFSWSGCVGRLSWCQLLWELVGPWDEVLGEVVDGMVWVL